MITNVTDCPYYLLTRCSLSITSFLKKGFADAEIPQVKPAYISILICLWEKEQIDTMLSKFGYEDGMKLVDLGRKAALEPSTMTGLIDRMERDGLVIRTINAVDRRAQIITLTEFGRNVREKVLGILEKTIDQVFSSIPRENIEAVKHTLQQVLINLNKGDSEQYDNQT
jgi:DNA-binding MarR family transcriptional regulator